MARPNPKYLPLTFLIQQCSDPVKPTPCQQWVSFWAAKNSDSRAMFSMPLSLTRLGESVFVDKSSAVFILDATWNGVFKPQRIFPYFGDHPLGCLTVDLGYARPDARHAQILDPLVIHRAIYDHVVLDRKVIRIADPDPELPFRNISVQDIRGGGFCTRAGSRDPDGYEILGFGRAFGIFPKNKKTTIKQACVIFSFLFRPFL